LADPTTYEHFIEQAYLKCLRSVLIIDDDYPTLESLLRPHETPPAEGQTGKTWGADPATVLNIVRGFRTQDPPLIVDIHDGANIGEEPELRVAEHLHQSDLLVLDFCLDKSRKDDGSEAIRILRKLAGSSHFNLVMMHSSLEPTQVFRDVVVGLLPREATFGFEEELEAAHEHVDAIDPDLFDELSKRLLEDDAAYFEARKDPSVLSHRGKWKLYPFAGFTSLCDEKGVDPDMRAPLLASILTAHHEAIGERLWDAKDMGPISYSSISDDHLWVKLNTVFIGFTQKRDNADLLADLKLSLADWHPQPSRLMLKQLLVELDDRGATAETLALGTKYASAKWYHDLLSASDSEQDALLSETLSRHIHALLSVIEPPLLKFSKDLVNLDAEGDHAKSCRQHYKVNLNTPDDRARAVSENNLLVSTLPAIRGRRLQTGHIFKLGEDYWVCLSAACDLVPGQQKPARVQIFGEDRLPFLAVRLHSTTEKVAGKNATDKRFIYLKEDGETKCFCINAADKPGSYLDWHTFIATNSGVFNPDTRILGVVRNRTDEGNLVLTSIDAEIVGQLRYTYAVNLAQELGRWLSRIGLDFMATN
jgi:hypothetical protein